MITEPLDFDVMVMYHYFAIIFSLAIFYMIFIIRYKSKDAPIVDGDRIAFFSKYRNICKTGITRNEIINLFISFCFTGLYYLFSYLLFIFPDGNPVFLKFFAFFVLFVLVSSILIFLLRIKFENDKGDIIW